MSARHFVNQRQVNFAKAKLAAALVLSVILVAWRFV